MLISYKLSNNFYAIKYIRKSYCSVAIMSTIGDWDVKHIGAHSSCRDCFLSARGIMLDTVSY